MSNEDGFSAGNTGPTFDDGPLFDFRLAFNAVGDGAPFFDQSNDIFEATLTLTDLTVDDFLTESAVNPLGMPGDPGPFEVSLLAAQLSPGAGGGYFSGTPAPEPGTVLLMGIALSGLGVRFGLTGLGVVGRSRRS